MTNEDVIIRLAGLEERAKQIEQNIQIVEENSIDLEKLKLGIEEIKDSKGKEILASIGRGIFVKARLEGDEFLTDVGGRNFVKKDINDIQGLISENVDKLKEIKVELFRELEDLNGELQDTLESVESASEKE